MLLCVRRVGARYDNTARATRTELYKVGYMWR